MINLISSGKIQLTKICIILLFSFSIIGCKDEPMRSNEKQILSFSIDNTNAIIDENQKIISVRLNYNTNIAALAPDIMLSDKARVVPASGVITNFTNPVKYSVTAENGTTQIYTVYVTKEKNNENKILDFELSFTRNNNTNVYYGAINHVEKKIEFAIPFSGIYFPDLRSNIKISPAAKINPASGFPVDFTKPFVYTIIADNGDTAKYTVFVKNSENYIHSFNVTIPNYPSNIDLDIHFPAGNILPEVKNGITTNDYILCQVLNIADISNLTPEINISPNAQILPVIAPVNFNNQIVYTIKSESGSSRPYTVKFIKRSIILPNDILTNVYNTISNNTYTPYDAISEIIKVELQNVASAEIIPCTITESKREFDYKGYIFFKPNWIPTDKTAGYKLRVYLKNGEVILTGQLYSA